MNFFSQLKAISKLNGQFTESVLIHRGISKTAIARSLSSGLLRSNNTGILSTVQVNTRTAKLIEALAGDLAPGRQIGVLNPDTKQMMQRQVMKIDGNDVYVVDPVNPQAEPEKVPLEAISIGDERTDDNKPIDPQKQSQERPETTPSGQASSAPKPTSSLHTSPTV